MSSITIDSTLKLHTGTALPQLGYGVYLSDRETCKKSVLKAIEVGYRQIDCAQYYENEDLVGEATLLSDLPRSALFLTTKTFYNSEEKTVDAILPGLIKSVKKMNPKNETGPYVDLFLIHAPTCGPEGRQLLWDAFQELKKQGYAKDIGVSNFGVKHIQGLKGEKPAVNQTELHPFCQQKEVVKYCQDNGIILQAYCPLVRNSRSDNATLQEIAKETKKSVTQILVRWSLQRGFSPLPKSDSHQADNANVYDFELSKEQMGKIDALDEGAAGAVAPHNVNCP